MSTDRPFIRLVDSRRTEGTTDLVAAVLLVPLAIAVCVPLKSNITWAGAPGNVLPSARATGLPKDSVASVSQIIAIDRWLLSDRVGRASPMQLTQMLQGVDVVLGR